ncbi:BON domain-containing protein [Methylotenera sp.]|nr:BON domain-containing protein [Methylotenera sp.]MDP3776294.1 BON domain-containing protein [Methylotenera sp.]
MKVTSIKLSAFMIACLVGLTACENPNTAENAGKEIDIAVEKAEKKIDQASEKMGESSDQAVVEVEDATITAKIKAAFIAESTIKSLDINVSTTDGVVTLTGIADSLESSQKATDVAMLISEVKKVENQLIIKR